jgi:hypothetical protein
MKRAAPGRGAVPLFLLKFSLFASALLGLWWVVQPLYVELAGQAAGLAIRYVAGLALTGMKVTVDASGVLNTKTSLVYLYEGRPIEIKVAFLIANLPAYFALILATGGLTWRRRLRALGLGAAILFAGHVAFLAIMFTFSREVRGAPEVPTAFGLFVMTLPFPLWIVFAYWDRAAAWLDAATGAGPGRKAPPGE